MRDDLDIPMPVSGPNFRVPRRKPGMDPNTRRLMLIAGAIGGTLVVLVGAWSLTGRRHDGGLPVVEAAAGPLRSKPADPGGMTVMGKDSTILSDRPEGEPKLAPAPEAPALAALRQQAEAEKAARAAELARQEAAKAEAAKAELAKAEAAKTEKARLEAAHAPPAPMPDRTPAPPPVPTQKVALTAPLPRPPAPPAPRVAPAHLVAPARPAPAAGRGTQVQLAALGSEAAAMNEWKRLERRMPRLLDGRTPSVTRVEHGGHVFYRLRTGGFPGTAQAGAFCAEVKAKGGGCAIAAF